MNNNQDNRNKNKGGREGRDPLRTGLPLLALAVVIVLLFNWVYNSITSAQLEEKSYTDFLTMVQNNQLAEVQFEVDRVLFITKEEADRPGASQTIYYTGLITNTDNTQLVLQLQSQGVTVFQEPQEDNSIIGFILSNLLILGLTFFLLSLLMRKMSSSMGGGLGGVGQSKAKVYMEKQTGVTFADVAGQDEAKESLQEIIDFLHNPQKYAAIGAKLPKGALLVGSPGTGKTLLAKAVAGEANVPFFSISGSDFVEMFVGVGASRVRDLFQQASKVAPCIIFIDEIDAVGRARDARFGSNSEQEQTLNQLLGEIDGFDSSKGVVCLAATNRPEILDKALLRAGRFDRRIIVDRPNLQGRLDTLKVHTKRIRLAEDVDLHKIAQATAGAVGADLANLVN